MSVKKEVDAFLNDFHQKSKIFDIVFLDNRGKNIQALADLELNPNERKVILERIRSEDYSQGPISDECNTWGDMWVFGKKHKGSEIYIKIALGKKDYPAICISFHLAEHPIKYPLQG